MQFGISLTWHLNWELMLTTSLVVSNAKAIQLSTVTHQTVKGYLSTAHYHIVCAAQTFEGPAVELGKKKQHPGDKGKVEDCRA